MKVTLTPTPTPWSFESIRDLIRSGDTEAIDCFVQAVNAYDDLKAENARFRKLLERQVQTMSMEKLIGPKDAAEILGVKLSTIYAWTCRRRLPSLKVGSRLRFTPSMLTHWLRHHERSEKPTSAKAKAALFEQEEDEKAGAP